MGGIDPPISAGKNFVMIERADHASDDCVIAPIKTAQNKGGLTHGGDIKTALFEQGLERQLASAEWLDLNINPLHFKVSILVSHPNWCRKHAGIDPDTNFFNWAGIWRRRCEFWDKPHSYSN